MHYSLYGNKSKIYIIFYILVENIIYYFQRIKGVFMQIDKRIDESPLQYHKRLVYGKLIDKTLSDCDYSELSELVYGKPYSSDVARRMLYGSCKTLQLLDECRESEITDTELLSEIDNKKIELQKERQKFYDQRRELNKIINQDGRYENLENALIEAANNLKKSVGMINPLLNNLKKYSYNENEAVVVFSDWHYGMTTDNVFNEYNIDICKQRIQNTLSEVIKRIELHECRKVHIVILGDLIHGACHVSARVASEELVCDQLMQVSEILAQVIAKISEYTEEVHVYSTYGNHARVVQNKNDNIHADNIERIIPWWMQYRLKDNENIIFEEPEKNELIFFEVNGHGICASHGDLDRVHRSPQMLTTLFSKKYKKDIEYILLGDKHHRESFNELGVTAMVCGALCGTDDYASDKRLFSLPEQTMLIINSDGIDAEYHIKC